MSEPGDGDGVATPAQKASAPTSAEAVPALGAIVRTPARLADRVTSRLEARRSSWIVDIGLFALERNRRIPSSLFAGALASRFLIFAIPFIAMVAVTTGVYADVSGGSATEIAKEVGMPGLLTDVASDSSEASDGFRLVTMVAMAFGTVWAADSLARLMRRIYALMWGVRLTSPRWRWSLPVSVLAVGVVGLASSAIGLQLERWSWGLVLSAALAEVAVLTAIWLAVIRLLPRNPDARWFHQLPGALVVGVGVVAMKTVTVVYFAPHAVALTDRYGDIAAAVLLLTWALWLAFIVIYGAELNAALFRSHDRRLSGS